MFLQFIFTESAFVYMILGTGHYLCLGSGGFRAKQGEIWPTPPPPLGMLLH